jgi:phosphate transport system substrate-binding protein
VDGSTTVLPVSNRMAAEFRKANPDTEVAVESSGTGGGFKKFCAGGVDIAGASRPIDAEEARECDAARVDYVEPVGFDSLTVVVNPKNAFVSCLTVSELRTIWEPAAESRVTQWNQVRANFPAERVWLYGPGAEHGTFDYFTLAIVGTSGQSRTDYIKNDDGNVSRPLFIYLSKAAAARPDGSEFARFFVAPENAHVLRDVGYVPLSPASLLIASRRIDRMQTGSIFKGRGAVVGVPLNFFEARIASRAPWCSSPPSSPPSHSSKACFSPAKPAL